MKLRWTIKARSSPSFAKVKDSFSSYFFSIVDQAFRAHRLRIHQHNDGIKLTIPVAEATVSRQPFTTGTCDWLVKVNSDVTKLSCTSSTVKQFSFSDDTTTNTGTKCHKDNVWLVVHRHHQRSRNSYIGIIIDEEWDPKAFSIFSLIGCRVFQLRLPGTDNSPFSRSTTPGGPSQCLGNP